MISVVVPVYNEEVALPAFLEMASRLRGDYELLFADGGSTDATLDILRRAGRRVVTGALGPRRPVPCRGRLHRRAGRCFSCMPT